MRRPGLPFIDSAPTPARPLGEFLCYEGGRGDRWVPNTSQFSPSTPVTREWAKSLANLAGRLNPSRRSPVGSTAAR